MKSRLPTQFRGSAVWPLLVALGLAAAIGGGWLALRPRDSAASDRPLVVIASCDTAGWIMPCGCTSNQSGGLARRGGLIDEAAQDAAVVTLDVGGAAGGASPFERARFAAILRGEMLYGIAAHNLGAAELKFGATELRKIAAETKAPLLSANIRDEAGELVVTPGKIISAGGRRLAVIGVCSPQYSGPGLTIDEPAAAILDTLRELRAKPGGALTAVVVLAYLPADELEALAARLPEVDLVLGGPTRQSMLPRRIGPTLVAAVNNKGKFVARLERDNGPNGQWNGEVIEVNDKFTDSAQQLANLEQFHRELDKRDFAADETDFVQPLAQAAPTDYQVAGSAACATCHEADYNSWQQTGHAHAWDTLVKDKTQSNSYCQQCHTTGYGLPGGFVSAGRTPQRVEVGCESCHGPSQAHARQPSKRTTFIARDQCTRCHDQENSPQFDYAKYWPRIEHGASAEKSSSPTRPATPTEGSTP